jgi:hypothetical protein
MTNTLKSFAVAAIMASGAFAASASVIDFQSFPVGAIAGGSTTITVDGVDVRFSAPGLQIRDITSFGFPAGSSRVLSSTTDAGPIQVDFLNGFTADFVDFQNWINGTYTTEVDTPLGIAYDAAHNVLDTYQGSATIHHLNGPGIAEAIYTAPSTGFVLDNFTFRGSSSQVPEGGSTLVLLGLSGLALFGARCRQGSR